VQAAIMYKKLIVILAIFIVIAAGYKLFFWSLRDYYYQLKYGAFMVDYTLQGKDQVLFITSIKKLTPIEMSVDIDPAYFEAVGYHDWQRIPTVYPYTINFFNYPGGSDHYGQGAILTNSNQVDYGKNEPDDPAGSMAYLTEDFGEVIEENIIAFSFDSKYLLSKCATDLEDNNATPGSVISYSIFEFSSAKLDRFSTYQQLMEAAEKRGYKRQRFPLDYTRETEDTKTYKTLERSKVLNPEETELAPFQLFFDRFTGLPIEL
jgi:hypothetical protein